MSIPGYPCHPSESGIEHSRTKINQAAEDLHLSCKPSIFFNSDPDATICKSPCLTEEETLQYRCSCSFQIMQKDIETKLYQYSMREKKEPIVLESKPYFPIALSKIQRLMDVFLHQVLNHTTACEDSAFQFRYLRNSLSSISFHSSWDEVTDCFITLIYSEPFTEEATAKWIQEAQSVCDSILAPLKLSGIIGRSKKKKFIVLSKSLNSLHVDKEISDDFSIILRDTICPDYPNTLDTTNHSQELSAIKIKYHKPLEAFHHPNGKVMMKALAWILTKISGIVQSTKNSPHLRLLELYCGCGAHTIPIAKLNVLYHIVAVEMDDRLVAACKENWNLNRHSGMQVDKGSTCTTLDVMKEDAGNIARLILHKRWLKEERQKSNRPAHPNSKPNSWYTLPFDMLLVDPPKQGLDISVCELAMKCSEIQHIIYISCGREALKRDLQILGDSYEVRECCLMDLFPRTWSSVESLVHLQRRSIVT